MSMLGRRCVLMGLCKQTTIDTGSRCNTKHIPREQSTTNNSEQYNLDRNENLAKT
jgi:hypothetical protein